ncbi:MAG: kinase-like domain-containing protein [Monoraphidium minutum]|nr:MAG: kinase-like domain-containing protein [Monoraphidium minutum]
MLLRQGWCATGPPHVQRPRPAAVAARRTLVAGARRGGGSGGGACRASADERQAEREALDLPFESDGDAGVQEPTRAKLDTSVPLLRPAALTAGTVLDNRYTVESQLGAGANAITYRARDDTNGEQVAVKAMSLKALKDWKQLELFQREAVVLQSLAHPNIPKYLGYFEEDTPSDRCFYIVQQEARGRSLADMLQSGMRADEKEVLRIACELLSVLKYLGSLRPPVVHRDIKPENVVLEGGVWGGRVYLIDFGGVQGSSPAGDSLASTIVGTYGYLAPEQFRGGATPASDLYALGGTLLYLVSGQPPFAFPQERMRIAYRDRVTVGPQLGELLDGLLEPVAEDRMAAQEAIDIATGKAAKRRRRAAEQGAAAGGRAGAAGGGGQRMVTLADGSVVQVTGPGGAGRPLPRGVRKPAGTRILLDRAPGRLDVEIPPEGLSGNSMGTGVFAVAWNAFVAFWTFSALASGGILFALFSAPFWYAGWQLAGQAFGGALTKERFAIGRNKFRLAQELAVLKDGAARFLGQGYRSQEGDASDVTGARVVTTVIVNGSPRTAIELVAGVNKFRFGESLELVEQEWVVSEINAFLEERSGRAPQLEDMAAAAPPEVYDDGDIGVTAGNKADPFWGMRDDDRSDPFRDRDRRF